MIEEVDNFLAAASYLAKHSTVPQPSNLLPVYLDSAAMHPTLPCAREAFLSAPFGNPSSEHQIGIDARNALEFAREKIASLMDCEPEEIVFTSTATEAAALAIHSVKMAGYDVFPSNFEHHAISENISNVQYHHACSARMLANNETGEILCPGTPSYKADNILWLCDATAAVGHMPVSFRAFGCDYLLFDAIKFGGVPGAAALIAKKGAPLSPLIRGGGQERGMRSGTENVPAICAMAAALEWQKRNMDRNTEYISGLQMRLYELLSEIKNHHWNTPLTKPHVHHILNISFDGVDAHALALILSKDGVMVSPGAACSNGKNEPSHVIMAMFHDEARARSAIRISMSHENTMDECTEAAEKIKSAVAYLRSIT